MSEVERAKGVGSKIKIITLKDRLVLHKLYKLGMEAAVEDWARKHGINFGDFQELCQKEETIKEVYASLLKAAKAARLEKFEIPAKIKLLSEAWTPESGPVTAALKLKRDVIKKVFSHELAQLYSS